MHKSDLIIIAGRPSMGKTSLGTNIAFNAAKKFKEQTDELGNKKVIDGGKVAFFSLEMSSEQLATRVLAEQTKISGYKMRKAELSKDDFKKNDKVSSELEYLNLIIDDNPDIRIILDELIQEAGYKTRLAANYNQALSEIDKK